MSLGPGRLNHAAARSVLKRKRHRSCLRAFATNRIDWADESLATVKSHLRMVLRREQQGRCVFCRRLLKVERRNACEDIEHFLDKSKKPYRRWAFCCVNITLACHACNLEKGTRDLGGAGVSTSVGYVTDATAYKWIHPYFNDFHLNIEVGVGWTYTVRATAPTPAQAKKLIEDLKLVEVQRIEEYAEQITSKMRRLTVLAGKCLKKGQSERATHLLEALVALQNETTFG